MMKKMEHKHGDANKPLSVLRKMSTWLRSGAGAQTAPVPAGTYLCILKARPPA
jgi:hypothetical protein